MTFDGGEKAAVEKPASMCDNKGTRRPAVSI